MQNRYVGDIGDFGKLGLLRAISSAGLSIGVNWYLNANESHNGDGCHVEYLFDHRYSDCDAYLWSELKRIVESDRREVASIERSGVLPATYYSIPITRATRNNTGQQRGRKKWHSDALNHRRDLGVVFLDPDNGLMVPSALRTNRTNKYVEPEEILDYYRQGSSVIYYQHKARKLDEYYTGQHQRLLEKSGFDDASSLGLKFKSTSQRFYFFIIQPRHERRIRDCVDKMLSTDWGKHFCLAFSFKSTDAIIQRRDIPMNETRRAVISVLGTDKKGIIAQVSRILYENDANILDISQTIVSGLFSMILIADIASPECSFDTLKTELDALGDRLGVQIRTQRSEIFGAMHQI